MFRREPSSEMVNDVAARIDQRRIRELEHQVEHLEYDRREAEYQRQRDREERRRQERQEMIDAQCEASSWDEAFRKQIARCSSEVGQCGAEDGDIAAFFEEEMAVAKAALEMYRAKMDGYERKVLREIADKLRKDFPKNSLSETLTNKNVSPSDILYW